MQEYARTCRKQDRSSRLTLEQYPLRRNLKRRKVQKMSTMFPVSVLQEAKYNARKTFTKESLEDLVASIKEKGVQIPLIIRPIGELKRDGEGNRYEIVAGARRFRAATILKLTEVPAILRNLSDEEAREVQIIENLQRSDLHPMEEAESFSSLMEESKLSAADVAVKVGKSEAYVRQRLVLSQLVPDLAKMFKADEIAPRVAFLCARQTTEHQKEIAKWLGHEDEPTYGNVSHFIGTNFHLDLSAACFDTSDAKLVKKAGSCLACPKRTGNSAMLFDDVKSVNVCTDSVCFHVKEQAFVQIQVKAHPKAVALSASSQWDSAKATGTRVWTPARTPCKNVLEGIIVQRSTYNVPRDKDFKLGSVLEVCVNKDCSTHFQSESYSGGNSRSGPMTEAEKKERRAERIAVKVDAESSKQLVEAVRKNPKSVTDDDIRRFAISRCEEYAFYHTCGWLAPGFGVIVDAKGKTPSQHGKECQDKLVAFLKKASRQDLLAFMVASEMWPDRETMRKHAARFGVDVKAITKEVSKPKAKPVKQPKQKGKGGRSQARVSKAA